MKKTTDKNKTLVNEAIANETTENEVLENTATEIEAPAKPKKAPAKKKTATKKASPKTEAPVEPVAAETEAIENQSAEEVAPEAETKPAKKKAATKRKPRRPSVISVNDERTVKTDEDALKEDILDVIESMKSHKILTDTIIGVESVGSKKVAVVFHGSLKIIIPSEMLIPESSVSRTGDDYEYALAHSTIKRLGAEIDYIVEKFDAEANVAVANRVRAMKARQKQYYLGFDRHGNKIVYPDAYCEGRVVSVLRNGVFVELFGVEVYIRLNELSYQRVINPENDFAPGQKVLVKILEVDTSNKNDIKVSASIKQARENPAAKALEKFAVDNYYMGTVTMIDNYGIFVSLDGGVDCLCKFPLYERPLRGARASVRIVGIDRENNKIWGEISHISNVL